MTSQYVVLQITVLFIHLPYRFFPKERITETGYIPCEEKGKQCNRARTKNCNQSAQMYQWPWLTTWTSFLFWDLTLYQFIKRNRTELWKCLDVGHGLSCLGAVRSYLPAGPKVITLKVTKTVLFLHQWYIKRFVGLKCPHLRGETWARQISLHLKYSHPAWCETRLCSH